MQKFILTITVSLISIGVSAWDYIPYKPPQSVCIAIDKNASNSRWTRRDETAKMHIYARYENTDPGKLSFFAQKFKDVDDNGLVELNYGKAAVCKNVPVPNFLTDRKWKFNGNIKIGVQYGGDCKFKYQRGKTVNVTIHKRRGNLVEPWSCSAN